MIAELRANFCRRIEFVFPSAEPALWPAYGITPDVTRLEQRIQLLQATGIEVEARIGVGGPEATPSEATAVVTLLRELRFCPFSLHPATVEFDAPLYAAQPPGAAPELEQWMRWARDPWMAEKPTALWGGAAAVKPLTQTLDRIERSVMRSPRRRWLRFIETLRSVRVIESMESAALQAVSRRPAADE